MGCDVAGRHNDHNNKISLVDMIDAQSMDSGKKSSNKKNHQGMRTIASRKVVKLRLP